MLFLNMVCLTMALAISVKRGVTTGLDATQIQTLDDVVGEAVKVGNGRGAGPRLRRLVLSIQSN
jgi:hypothetical protein